ncbi:MAG: hypothetical protein IPM42_15535 [Saprospiraceae bacterium]|nr:hypothetical protein [Saprospiraceae bacterium]
MKYYLSAENIFRNVKTGLFIILSWSLINQLSGQNVGVNNTDPMVSLDVSGALAHRGTVVNPVANAVALPTNVTFVVISNQDVTGPVTVTDQEVLVDGRRLVLYNNSGYTATFNGVDIENSTVKEFICRGSGTGWLLLSSDIGSNSFWKTNGNSDIDSENHFLGTSDEQTIGFRTNNTERMRLTDEGLKIKDNFSLELGYGIMDKPYGNGSIFYNIFGQTPTLDIYGGGIDFTGYDRKINFWAGGGSSFTGGASFNGNVSVNGEIQPNGSGGEKGQVLTNVGFGQMNWDFPEKTGQMIEVSPYTADTAALAEQGYKLMGTQNRTIEKTTANGGTISPLVNQPQLDASDYVFHYSASGKIFVVNSETIYNISLQESDYGEITNYTLPSFNLNNTIPVFTGTKILIYPFFIFDCASGTTTNFAANTCPGFTYTETQVWTGSKLIIYGPNGGITYDPGTSIYTCIETTIGNLYYPGSTTTWTGNLVVFYGGYTLSFGDTISVDIGLIYNPTLNTWNDVPVGGPRLHSHLALWTGTEVMFFGGRMDESIFFDGIHFYNPVSFVWNSGYTPVNSSLITRKHTRSYLAGSKVFVMNIINYDSYLNQTFATSYFDLSTKTWVSFSTGIKNSEELAFCASVVAGPDIYYFPKQPCGHKMDYLHFFVIETNPIQIYPKYSANIVTPFKKNIASSGNYIFAFGMLGGGLCYQKSKNRWNKTLLTDQPTDREGHVNIQVGIDSFFIWGGNTGNTYHNSGRIYNAATNTWTYTPTFTAPSVRTGSTAAFGGGYVMVWGGNNGGAYINNGKLYNVATNTWSNISAIGAPSCTTHSFIDWNGSEFLVYCNGINKYNPVLNSWQFLYPDSESNINSSSSSAFQMTISGRDGVLFDKANNIHYKMDGNGLEFVYHKTQFINANDAVLAGYNTIQLYNAISKDFKFTSISYLGMIDNQSYPIFHSTGVNTFLVLGFAHSVLSDTCGYTDAMMVFAPNTGSPITKDINVQSLLYRKD